MQQEIKKAIQLNTTANTPEDTIIYDCDYAPFKPIIEQLNAMGAPVTLYDLMELIDSKLDGTLISGKEDAFLQYSLIVKKDTKTSWTLGKLCMVAKGQVPTSKDRDFVF